MSSRSDINYRMPVLRLLHGVKRQGLNVSEVLNAVGIRQDILNEPDLKISNVNFISLLMRIQSILGDDFYGLSSKKLKKGSIAMLNDIALHGKNLESALLGMQRFIHLVSDDFELKLLQYDGDARLVIEQRNQQTDPEFFLADYLLFYFHRLCSWLIGYLIPVSSVRFRGPAGNGDDRLIDLLSIPYMPESCDNSIVFNVKYLSMPVVRNSYEWLQHVDNMRGGVFHWPNDGDWIVSRVEKIITQRLNDDNYCLVLDEVAELLAISAQTLRRRLKEENSSFQSLVDRIRCNLAVEALYLHRLSIEKTSELLGFSEARSFSRAFKKWTGIPPSEYLRRATVK